MSASSHPRDRLARELGLRDATLLVVSGVVGSGIFLTPGGIADVIPSAGLIFVAWLLGGLLSLAGALSNAELAAMYPRAGGDYVYLREAFHPLAGFVVGWLSFLVIYAGTIATLAVGFMAGLSGLVPFAEGTQRLGAVMLILAVSALNFFGVRWGARANNGVAYLKIALIVAFGFIAFASGNGDSGRLVSGMVGGVAVKWSMLALVLSPILFSYLGWNSSIYVASEVRDPERNVPRSLFLGLAICTALYLLLNAVYLYALPLEELRGAPNVGEAVAGALFGSSGGVLVGVFVLASILGTLNATVLVGPRIAYAMALDGLFFAGVDRSHERFRTPSAAIGVQAGMAVAIVLLLGSFDRALTYTTFAILLATMADVAALYYLRRSRPDARRPYRAWGYPWIPACYFVVCGGVALAIAISRPTEALAGILISATALPFYFYFSRKVGGPGTA
ncbi:amino acid permease [Myxococcota bacterium]|nr:amino acid permease [Myxococcota bacterium]